MNELEFSNEMKMKFKKKKKKKKKKIKKKKKKKKKKIEIDNRNRKIEFFSNCFKNKVELYYFNFSKFIEVLV